MATGRRGDLLARTAVATVISRGASHPRTLRHRTRHASDAPDYYFDSHGLAKEWMIHSPLQNDIIQKGLHFHAPGMVELGVFMNDGAIDFQGGQREPAK